jgi:thiol-disulfide isomerase/thioredoxin
MTRARRQALGAVLLLLLFPAAPVAAAEETSVAPLAGIRLEDLQGETIDLGRALGKGPIVLDFWATWCKPCVAALPELNKLHVDLAPRGLQLFGINEDGQRNASKVEPFVRTHGVRFPVLLDLNREAQSRLNVVVLPTTMLLDSTGKVHHTSFGYRAGEVEILRRKIESLLEATPKE